MGQGSIPQRLAIEGLLAIAIPVGQTPQHVHKYTRLYNYIQTDETSPACSNSSDKKGSFHVKSTRNLGSPLGF